MNYKKSLRNQTKYISIDDDGYHDNGSNVIGSMFLLITGIAFGCVLTLAVKGCDRQPMPAVIKHHTQLQCKSCHSKLATYLRKKGNKEPEVLADALYQTRNPRLLAAMAVGGEKNSPIKSRHGGYKGRHQGAFQVNPTHWGTVPKDAVGQAKQAEAILQELTETRPIKQALNYYGGESDLRGGRYAENVLRELQEVPR